MNLFNFGKSVINKFPKLLKFSCGVYNLFSINKIRIRGKNNKLIKNKSFIKNCKIIIKGNNNFIDLGNMCYLNNTKITIFGDNNIIKLGDKVYISNGDLYLEDNSNKLNIQDKTIFAGNVHLALTEGKNVEIGKKCLFSSNIVLRTGDSHSILDLDNNRINLASNIEIGEHVWITQNVTVLKGSKISDNSVVATGSIVTKKIENKNVLIAGNPAKVIKENINWINERI